ncbi:MAG: LuxR family transcriptional regulator [Deltaproteobacteria bacterium]|nr:LuxR family transcriptional regulator [Deltaproteobacteria bacterium]
MRIDGLYDELQQFGAAEGSGAIAELLRKHADELGYASFIYALRVPATFADAKVVQIKGYPDAWLDRYWEASYYAVDPVIDYCTHHILPIEWDRLVPRMSAAGRRMMGAAGEFGLQNGVSMPIHGAHGELGILSFARRHGPPLSRAGRRRVLGTVQLIAAHAHEAVRRVERLVEATPVILSARELECLRWAADGKTSWEISRIANISERTVNFHFDNSVAKLGASNRQHAIAKAITLGILSPRPF